MMGVGGSRKADRSLVGMRREVSSVVPCRLLGARRTKRDLSM